MEEGRQLLSITREEEGVSASWQGHGFEDLMSITLVIVDYARRNPAFLTMLLCTLKQSVENEEFQEALDESVIEMPDFNQLLKNTNNE